MSRKTLEIDGVGTVEDPVCPLAWDGTYSC